MRGLVKGERPYSYSFLYLAPNKLKAKMGTRVYRLVGMRVRRTPLLSAAKERQNLLRHIRPINSSLANELAKANPKALHSLLNVMQNVRRKKPRESSEAAVMRPVYLANIVDAALRSSTLPLNRVPKFARVTAGLIRNPGESFPDFVSHDLSIAMEKGAITHETLPKFIDVARISRKHPSMYRRYDIATLFGFASEAHERGVPAKDIPGLQRYILESGGIPNADGIVKAHRARQ